MQEGEEKTETGEAIIILKQILKMIDLMSISLAKFQRHQCALAQCGLWKLKTVWQCRAHCPQPGGVSLLCQKQILFPSFPLFLEQEVYFEVQTAENLLVSVQAIKDDHTNNSITPPAICFLLPVFGRGTSIRSCFNETSVLVSSQT